MFNQIYVNLISFFCAYSEVQIRLRGCADLWVFAVIMWRRDSSHVSAHFYSTESGVQIRLCRYAGSYGYSLFSCGVGKLSRFGAFVFQQTAKSRSGCAGAQAHMGIRCSHVA